jgi:hypothetical protein
MHDITGLRNLDPDSVGTYSWGSGRSKNRPIVDDALLVSRLFKHERRWPAEQIEQVAAWENDISVAGLSSDAYQRVYIALYQCYLPKLAETGVIEYNRDRGLLAVFKLYLDKNHTESVLTVNHTETDLREGDTIPSD